jgi:hypothetical protein
MSTEAVTITRRNRNLGIAWTNETEQQRTPSGGSFLAVRDPGATPDVTGSIRDISAEYDRARRIHSGGTSWRVRFFVDGRPVDADDMREAMASLLQPGIRERGQHGRTLRFYADSVIVRVQE